MQTKTFPKQSKLGALSKNSSENQVSKPSDMAVSMDKYCDCGNVRKRGFMLCSECLAYETSLEHSADISGEDY